MTVDEVLAAPPPAFATRSARMLVVPPITTNHVPATVPRTIQQPNSSRFVFLTCLACCIPFQLIVLPVAPAPDANKSRSHPEMCAVACRGVPTSG